MKFALVIAFVTVLAGCAALSRELRSGWVKVDFRDGKFHDNVVCTIEKDLEGDLNARCISIEDFAEMMAAEGLLERHGRPHRNSPGEL